MTDTELHGWPTPDDGTQNYEETFADFFTQIDKDVILVADDSNRSSYTPHSDAMLVDRNTGATWIGDGSSWTQIPTTGENPTFKSLSTERVENSSIGDGVDYADPKWLARSEAYHYQTNFESLNGFLDSTTGSGSTPTVNQNGVTLSTGTTSDSSVRLERSPLVPPDATWDEDQVFDILIKFDDAQGPLYAVSGLISESDKTLRHVGFAMSDGNLVGTVADGSNETTTTLDSSPTTGSPLRLKAILDHSAGDVTFVVNGTQQGSISTNLPSAAGRIAQFNLLAQNSTTTARSLTCAQSTLVIDP